MDSLTQASLGAAVGYAVMGQQIGRKALLWGAVVATLPDLDVFIPLGDDVAAFTQHRSASHSLFVHAAVTPVLAWIMGRVQRAASPHRLRCWLLVFLCLTTHALIDGLTAYGTQLWWPLPVSPVTWSTIFIIDPAYTLPLIVGTIGAMWARRGARRWNGWGLGLSSAYLVFTIAAKTHVDRVAGASLERDGVRQFMSIASPFNALLWRIVAMGDGVYREGYYSLFDSGERIRFITYPAHHELLRDLAARESVRRLRWFTGGFFAVKQRGNQIQMFDLRMGYEPEYVFGFQVGELRGERVVATPNRRLDGGLDVMTLAWIWRRIWDASLEPPSAGSRHSGDGEPSSG